MPSIADFCPHHNVFRIPGSMDISGKKLKMGKEMGFPGGSVVKNPPALPGRFFTTSTTWEAHDLTYTWNLKMKTNIKQKHS